MNLNQWSTAVVRPSFWWKLKCLFKPNHDILFMWGEDKFRIVGLDNQECFLRGGVPDPYKNDWLVHRNARGFRIVS